MGSFNADLAAAAAALDSEGERLARRAARQATRPRHPAALRRLRDDAREEVPRTVNGTGHTGPSEFCATSI